MALDGCWIVCDHESRGGDFHFHAKCLYNKTKFDSIPLGGYDVWHEEIQLLSAFESRRHQVLCLDHLQTLCAGLSERNPRTVLQLVLLVNILHKRPGNCISWKPSWDQYLADEVGSWQAHLDKTLTLAV